MENTDKNTEVPQSLKTAVSKSAHIESLERAIKKETDFFTKYQLQEILRIQKYGLPRDAPYLPMMP
jgi:hypothetical protein